MSEFEPTWMLQQVEFYADPQERISLVDDPEKAYASSVYTGEQYKSRCFSIIYLSNHLPNLSHPFSEILVPGL